MKVAGRFEASIDNANGRRKKKERIRVTMKRTRRKRRRATTSEGKRAIETLGGRRTMKSYAEARLNVKVQ